MYSKATAIIEKDWQQNSTGKIYTANSSSETEKATSQTLCSIMAMPSSALQQRVPYSAQDFTLALDYSTAIVITPSLLPTMLWSLTAHLSI